MDQFNFIKIARPSEQKSIHNILNQSPMEIGNISLKYSRLPSLYESYSESGLNPIIFVDKEVKNFSASFSELKCHDGSTKKTYYYSSDLRSTKKTTIQVRKEFRSLYSDVISYLNKDEICFTAVLAENKKALNALTKKSTYFNYNSLFDYTSITTIASPLDYFLCPLSKVKIKEVNCAKSKKQRDIYIEKKINQSAFSHEAITAEAREGQRDFIILRENQVVCFFSTYRPRNRKLLVESSNVFLDKFISLVSKGKKTLDWIYLTNFICLNENELFIKEIKKHLKKIKITKTFNLILLSTDSKSIQVPPLSISTNAKMFRVEKEQKDRSIQGRVYLNPLCL